MAMNYEDASPTYENVNLINKKIIIISDYQK